MIDACSFIYIFFTKFKASIIRFFFRFVSLISRVFFLCKQIDTIYSDYFLFKMFNEFRKNQMNFCVIETQEYLIVNEEEKIARRRDTDSKKCEKNTSIAS